MRTNNLFLAILFAGSITARVSEAQNPVVQTRYTADPAPMVYHDTVFLYTGHDEDKSKYFTMNDWHLFSSTDMVNWTDRGTPLSYKTFSWASGDAWAGQCIERNGKFYWYVPVKSKELNRSAIGVAVSDYPTGPFRDALGKPLVTNGWGDIDPTVNIDDTGQAYLYWGNPGLWYVKLNDDMCSYSGKVESVPLTEESFGKREHDPKRATLYEEGPWVYQRNGLYYLLFSAGPIPEHLAYATGISPTGPWVYRGTLMPTQGKSFTNHCGVIDFKGNSYFFYHNGDLPGGGGFDRSVCIEQFSYNQDGSIPRLNMTKAGVIKGIGHLNPYIRSEAETIAWEQGIKTEATGDAGVYITDIDDGDFVKVRSVDFGKGARAFEASTASATHGGNIELYLDSLTGPLVGTCRVYGKLDWNKWSSSSCKVAGTKGIHDLYLKFTGGTGKLFNINWWKFK